MFVQTAGFVMKNFNPYNQKLNIDLLHMSEKSYLLITICNDKIMNQKIFRTEFSYLRFRT